MKAEGLHEGCIEQIQRLFAERMYTGKDVPTDEAGRIRIDDLEMREDVQAKVDELWQLATTESLPEIGDLKGYSDDFHNLFGFKVDGVDYTQEVNPDIKVSGLVD